MVLCQVGAAWQTSTPFPNVQVLNYSQCFRVKQSLMKEIVELLSTAEALGVAFGESSSLLIALVDGRGCVTGSTYSLLEDMVTALVSTPEAQVLAG